MLKSVLVAFQTDEDQQLQKIASQDAKVSRIATLSDAETLNRLQDLEQPIHRIADQTATYAKSLEDARYREILDWLSQYVLLSTKSGTLNAGFKDQGSGCSTVANIGTGNRLVPRPFSSFTVWQGLGKRR
jgi:hypothetical protein